MKRIWDGNTGFTVAAAVLLLLVCGAPATAKPEPLAIPDHVYFTDIQSKGCEIWDEKCTTGDLFGPQHNCGAWLRNTSDMNTAGMFPWVKWNNSNHLCAEDNKWWHIGSRFDMERAIEKFITKNYGPEVHEDEVMSSYFKHYLSRSDLVVIFARILAATQGSDAGYTLERDVNTRVLGATDANGAEIPTPHGDYTGRNETLHQRTNEPKLYDDLRAMHPSFRYMEEVVDTKVLEPVHTLKGLRGDVERSLDPLADAGKDRTAEPERFVTREEFIAAFVSLVDYIATELNKTEEPIFGFKNLYCGPGQNPGYDNFKFFKNLVEKSLELNKEYTRFTDVSLSAGQHERRTDIEAAQNYPGFIVVAVREKLIDINEGAPDVRLKPDRYIDRAEAISILSKFFIGNWNEPSCDKWDTAGVIYKLAADGALSIKPLGAPMPGMAGKAVDAPIAAPGDSSEKPQPALASPAADDGNEELADEDEDEDEALDDEDLDEDEDEDEDDEDLDEDDDDEDFDEDDDDEDFDDEDLDDDDDEDFDDEDLNDEDDEDDEDFDEDDEDEDLDDDDEDEDEDEDARNLTPESPLAYRELAMQPGAMLILSAPKTNIVSDEYILDPNAYIYVRNFWKRGDIAEVIEMRASDFAAKFAGDKLLQRDILPHEIYREYRVVDTITAVPRRDHKKGKDVLLPAEAEDLVVKLLAAMAQPPQPAEREGKNGAIIPPTDIMNTRINNIGWKTGSADTNEVFEVEWADECYDDVSEPLCLSPLATVKALCVPDREQDNFTCKKTKNGKTLLGYLEIDMTANDDDPSRQSMNICESKPPKIAPSTKTCHTRVHKFRRHIGRVTGLKYVGQRKFEVRLLAFQPATIIKSKGQSMKKIRTYTFDLDAMQQFGERAYTKMIDMPGSADINKQHIPALGEMVAIYEGPTSFGDSGENQVLLYQPYPWVLAGRLRAMEINSKAELAVELKIDPLVFETKKHFRMGCDDQDNPKCMVKVDFDTHNIDDYDPMGYNVIQNRFTTDHMDELCTVPYKEWKYRNKSHEFCHYRFDVLPYLMWEQGIGPWNIYYQTYPGTSGKDSIYINIIADEIPLMMK